MRTVNGIIGIVPMWKPQLASSSAQPLFRRIAQAIADDIVAGRLTADARLPAHRDLADELGVARGTVARAYRQAEKLGLVRCEVGRGTRVVAPDGGERPYASLLQSPTVLSDLSTQLPLSGIDPDPAEALRQLADRPDRTALLRYHPPAGLPRHRMAGVHWLQRLGIDCGPEEVLLSAGAQQALFATIGHLSERSRALYVEELTYPGMQGIAETLGLPLVAVGMDAQGMHPTKLARVCAKHGPGIVYCMPTLHNPLGAVMSERRRKKLAAVALERGLYLVEDAANRMLLAERPRSLRAHAPERTFVVASVSKVLSPGLRVAFLLAPEAERSALVRRLWAMHWMPPPIGAEMVAVWLEDGTVDRTLRKKRREAARRHALARRAFGRRGVIGHPNALHLWLKLPRRWDADAFAAAAVRHDIVVTPSSAFWVRATPPPAAVRIALGGIDDIRRLRRKLAKLADLVAYGPE
jgi:DNA-binding transcriptional MocR family regulator